MSRTESRPITRRSLPTAVLLYGQAAACFLLAFALLGAAENESAGQDEGRSVRGGPGQVLYLTYCEACHGVDGRGNGPSTEYLHTPPPDLTRLWESYGVPLRREKLTEYIDGRRLLSVHEFREMPVWGDEFFQDSGDQPGVENSRRRVIEVLVDYLQALQTEQKS